MFKMKYEVKTKYLPVKTKRRSGTLMPYVGFIVSHDTGNDGSTALNNVNYYINSANDMSASAQVFIDDNGIWECIPVTTGKPEKAWHVLYNITEDNKLFGGDANDIAIGVELCYTNKKGKINNKEAYKRYVWYHAYLCYKFKIDPKKKIVGHNELDPDRKTDPFKNALKIMGISKAQFLQDVVNELADCQKKEEVVKPTPTPTPPSKPVIESEDDKPMKIEQWQKDLIIEGVKKYNKVIGTDGNVVINSPDTWIKKVNNETLTAGELATLTFAIVSRTQK